MIGADGIAEFPNSSLHPPSLDHLPSLTPAYRQADIKGEGDGAIKDIFSDQQSFPRWLSLPQLLEILNR